MINIIFHKNSKTVINLGYFFVVRGESPQAPFTKRYILRVVARRHLLSTLWITFSNTSLTTQAFLLIRQSLHVKVFPSLSKKNTTGIHLHIKLESARCIPGRLSAVFQRQHFKKERCELIKKQHRRVGRALSSDGQLKFEYSSCELVVSLAPMLPSR